ncbi:MAG TPA: hypothetical protein VMW40_05520 [Candidatus Bathyarchaeia archaeon]|nr:hypothetical protein [Candidatus Bathyarchaeia archaeon]
MIVEAAQKYNLEIEGIIPFDPLIPEYDAKGMPIVDLPDDAPSVTIVRRIVEKLL